MKRSKNFEKRKKFIMELLGDPLYKPMHLREIASLLQLDKSEKKELFDVLDELCAQGKAEVDNKGRYSKVSGKRRDRRKNKEALKAEKPERGRKGRERREKDHEEYRFSEKDGTLMEGTFIGHYKGFGFVEVEDQEQDIFIPENDTGSAMHQDKVQILVRNGHKEGKRQEGVVLKVLERGMPSIVGTYQSSRDYGFVISDNPKFSKDIFISRKNSMGAKDGDKVVAEITDYGSRNRKPEGKITEVLGNLRSPGIDILAIVKSFNIPSVFPDKVLRQADRVPDHVQEADLDGRLDLRNLVTVTIDGEDAKDLDDAISLTKEDGIYHLGVHIADVSNYVQGGSALDREALKRGTSVYLADRVIPMLPERLSNGICSLNQGQDRLTLSCLMDVNEKGKVISHKIAETVIRVDERMCYTDVKNILEDTDEVAKKRYEALIPMFFLMKELSGILRSRRHTRGSIDFDFPESKIILNAAGRAIDVQPYEANVATRIIEDFMLLANETVAKEYCEREIPFLYRVHETPDDDKMKKLVTFLQNFGYTMHMQGGQEIRPKEVQKLLDKIEGTPEEAMISRLALRSMKQARYSPDNDGHFGLATQYYTHFTSPIRRYPDLQIHRIIKDNLRGRMNDAKRHHYEKILPEVAMETSSLERRADEAERETLKLKKVQYMRNFFGQEFEGVISGITKWGIYVELPNTVEGLVHVTNMTDDHYDYDEEHYQMIGSHHRKTYKLGQKVRVKMIDCDEISRTIDFRLVKERKEEREDG